MIVGLAGESLGDEEAAFLRSSRPAGVIIFTRNAATPDQLRRLISTVREAIGEDDALVLIDQEGGRVQRLAQPHWRTLPAAVSYGVRYHQDADAANRAAATIAALTAVELQALGINANCVPCADRPVDGAHDIIGTRAYDDNVEVIAHLARVVAEAHVDAGVLPIVKHVPGHGRAQVDSHLELPIVEAPEDELKRTDFEPFRLLNDLPAAMTAHVVYTAIDPQHPATMSQRVIAGTVRGDIGFRGLLMSDDLSMKALEGELGERAAGAIAAGCDIALHCNGDLAEMREVADRVPVLTGAALERFRSCVTITHKQPYPLDFAAAEAILADHLAASR